MKHRLIKVVKIISLTALAVMLMLAGLLMCVYAGWFQRSAREALVKAMNARPGTHFELREFTLDFPLRLTVGGLTMVQNGDTTINAGRLDASVRLLPLLGGKVELDRAVASDVRYMIGNRDSATCIVITAGDMLISPAEVTLSPMHITLTDGALSRGTVDIFINQAADTTASDTAASSPMLIDVRRLMLNDFTYRMNMMPVIDSLGVHIKGAALRDGHIDVGRQIIKLAGFTGTGLDATYMAPDSAAVAAVPVAAADTATTASRPWTINIDSVSFDSSSALYTTRGYRPTAGFDPGYIALDSLSINVDGFYNSGADMTIPVKVSGRERCGLYLDLGARLVFDERGIAFDGINLATPGGTRLKGSGLLGTGDMTRQSDVPLALNIAGDMAAGDMAAMFPPARAYSAGLPAGTLMGLDVDISGTSGRLDISRLAVTVPRSLSLKASGRLDDVFDPSRMAGRVEFDGVIGDLSPWRRLLTSLAGIGIPPMSLDGDVTFGGGSYRGTVAARTAAGSLALDGYFNGRGNEYDLDLSTDNFPLDAFMPELKVGTVSSHITASGRGLNVFSASTQADARVDITHVVYNGRSLEGISVDASLAGGHADVRLTSGAKGADVDLTASGNLIGATYDWTADVDARDLDLQALGLSATPADVNADFDVSASLDARRPTIMAATLNLRSLGYTDSAGTTGIDRVKARIDASDTLINASVSNRDLYIYFSSPMSLQSLLSRGDSVTAALAEAHKARRIDIERLQRALPRFNLDVDAGGDNLITHILAKDRISFKTLTVEAYNDSTINLRANAGSLTVGETRLDTLSFDVHQRGNRLDYAGRLRNRPGTLDQWASVDVDGYFRPGRLGVDFRQRDLTGKTGYMAGAYIDLNPDSTATLHLSPLDPVIAYQKWQVNDDNFIRYNFATGHIDADLRMQGQGSSLALYTEHAAEHDASMHGADEDLVVKLTDIRLQDWIKLNPFAPPVKGLASADMRVNYDRGRLNARGNVSLADLIYGRERVGDLRADIDLSTDATGHTGADMALWVNGQKSLTITGLLNDSTSTSPFNLDLTMIHFPLSTLNAFMPGVARLQGTLNGSLDVSGDMAAPRLDGSLAFDSAAVRVDMLGTVFTLSPRSIPVKGNVVTLDDFTITGCNNNPLTLNGTVDLRSLSDISLDLRAGANQMQVVNSTRAAKGADVYGKAFVTIDARARGPLSMLDVDARLTLNSGTNVTYVMPEAVETLTSQARDNMVVFVNFNDSSQVAKADSITLPSTSMNVSALLTIAPNATIGVDLSANGQDRVQLSPTGTLDYSSTPMNDGRLTGRLDINKGFVRYTPPLISQKLFNFNQGSYVAFRGDMLDPQLNISATDRVRANVTQQGQNSRLIYFDVLLTVTGTLSNMDVVFDLATNDDVTIANELQSMSPTQRASQAMNLMLYNVYTGPGTKANANLSGNPLYSFLTSKLNSWAAGAIKGVDISFGIDQYDRTDRGVTSQTTSYSYQVSKSLFNDRFKISVGGNYSTDADADENLAQNLISDISLEYLLNKSGTMYVRIFRHTGYESILEGEITQTGVGFVYRRKIRRVADMFRLRRRRRAKTPPAVLPPADTTVSGKPLTKKL